MARFAHGSCTGQLALNITQTSLSQLDRSQAFYDFRMVFENFNLKTFKFVTTLTRRVWQNVKYREAELIEFNTKFFSIISEINVIGLNKTGFVQEIWISSSQRYASYPLSEKVFFVLDFVLGGINRKNFMVSCFPLINRPV